MKKSLTILLSFLFLITVPLSAQFKLSLAPAVGLNFNLHNGSDLPESGNGVGLVVGGYAHMMFSKNIGMIAGLAFYDNRSGSYSSTKAYQGVNVTSDVSASLAYFQIEPLLKIAMPTGLYFVAGPVLGFNIESEGEVKQSAPGYQSSTSKSTIKETLVRFELKAGAGYEIPIAKKIDIVPQVTFGYGLTNVVKDVKWKILTFQALCAVKFDL
jgi:hypothetical protein